MESAERVGVEYACARLFELGQIIHATKYETVRNLKTAEAPSLAVPSAVLLRRGIGFR